MKSDIDSIMKRFDRCLENSGEELDLDKARRLARRAAKLGDSRAATKLFDMSFRASDEEAGKGVFPILESLAGFGDVPSMVRLSKAYRNGFAVEKNESLSIGWMRKAAETGSRTAAVSLFDLLAGSEDPESRAMALDALKPFERSRSDSVAVRMAMAYRDGCGAERDLDKACEMLARANAVDPKWRKEQIGLAIELIKDGRSVIGSLERCRLERQDVDPAKALALLNREGLYLPLMETFVGKELTYLDGLSSDPDPARTISDDFNVLVGLLNWMDNRKLVGHVNVSATMNAILDGAKERGIIDDDDVMSIFRGLRLDDPYLEQIQYGLTVLLQLFDKICKENGIRYMISCGTLIGACRHGGFVPWDDDVDLYMMREDFSKLTAVLRDHPLLRVLNRVYASSIRNHGVNYAHQVVFKDPKLKIVHLGVIVYDYVESADEEGWDRYRAYIEDRRGRVNAYTEEDYANGTNPTKDRRIVAIYHECMKNFSRDLNGKDRKAVALTFDNPVERAYRRLFDLEVFFPERMMDFNGIVLPAPNHPWVVVDRLYGNVMRMPKDLLAHKHSEWNDENAEYIRTSMDRLKDEWLRGRPRPGND
ncbi:MAG: LicD family protein [Candidatus Methanomethylophilaceae archaeon]|nr:LicD family protein [Candidatus Methanomethylophilaceae archaeon]